MKPNMIKVILLGISFCGSCALHAQDITARPSSWYAVSFKDRGATKAHTSTFTISSNSILWVQSNGGKTLTDVFTIEKQDGVWSDIGKDGQVIYKVSSHGNAGTITLRRSAGAAALRLEYAAKQRIDLEFSISRYEQK